MLRGVWAEAGSELGQFFVGWRAVGSEYDGMDRGRG